MIFMTYRTSTKKINKGTLNLTELQTYLKPQDRTYQNKHNTKSKP